MSVTEKLKIVANNVPKVYEAGRNISGIISPGKPYIDSSKISNFNGFFAYDKNLSVLETVDTSGATDVSAMFQQSMSLSAIPPLDTSKALYMQSMFFTCPGLVTLPPLNTDSAITMNSMFYSCYNLVSVSLSNTRKVTDLRDMFYNCTRLVEVECEMDWTSVMNCGNCFYGCESLEKLIISGVISVNGFDVSWSSKLTKDSLISIINALSSTTEGLTVTLSLSAINKAFETSPGLLNGSESYEWSELHTSKDNWNVVLI